MAIIHIAMFDAVNAIANRYHSYTNVGRAKEDASLDAAMAQAAHDTLAALFPSQKPNFDGLLAEDLDCFDKFDKTQGIAQGRKVGDYVFENAFRPLHPEN